MVYNLHGSYFGRTNIMKINLQYIQPVFMFYVHFSFKEKKTRLYRNLFMTLGREPFNLCLGSSKNVAAIIIGIFKIGNLRQAPR